MIEDNQITSRVAQVGDIFILLVPSGSDLQKLRKWQFEFQSKFGGQIVDFIHITCQRFSPKDDYYEDLCITNLARAFEQTESLAITTDKIIQFYARYWCNFVIRWRVEETPQYQKFRNMMESILLKINCPSHFSRLRHASCTALNLETKLDISNLNQQYQFPQFLFTASELQVSKLLSDNQFEILATINLKKTKG